MDAPETSGLEFLVAGDAPSQPPSAARQVFEQDIRDYFAFCGRDRLRPMPADPKTIGAYVAHLGALGQAPSLLLRRLAAIAKAHEDAGTDMWADHPAIVLTLQGILHSRRGRTAEAL